MKSKIIGSKKGFTLIELIIVIAIMGILAAIIIPTYTGYTEKAREKACGANRGILMHEYTAWLAAGEGLVESNEGFQTHLQDYHEIPMACPSDGSSLYTWDTEEHTVLCPNHGKRVYDIQFTALAFPKTMDELSISFDDYMKVWMEKEGKLPVVNAANASLSWSAANYTGTDKTNLLQAKFWNDYYEFANVSGLNSTNTIISDFKVFFKRNASGVATSEVAGVYFQVGGMNMIRFSDGTTVTKSHYSNYIDPITKELKPK